MKLILENWRKYLLFKQKVLKESDVFSKVASKMAPDVTSGQPKPDQEISKDILQQKKKQPKVLIFGHSQSASSGIGGAQKTSLINQGVDKKNITHQTHTGKNDKNLLSLIKNIKGDFTHAILHLDGNNWWVSGRGEHGAVRQANSKVSLVNYVRKTLGVPDENIWIFVPPHNAQFKEYYGRGPAKYKMKYWGNLRALDLFRRTFGGVNVQPTIRKYPGRAFKDPIHLRKGSAGEEYGVRIA
jgi:hypothetical protein